MKRIIILKITFVNLFILSGAVQELVASFKVQSDPVLCTARIILSLIEMFLWGFFLQPFQD